VSSCMVSFPSEFALDQASAVCHVVWQRAAHAVTLGGDLYPCTHQREQACLLMLSCVQAGLVLVVSYSMGISYVSTSHSYTAIQTYLCERMTSMTW
jgi:hypothetical protein